jgi:hypothetical protein
MNRFIGLFRQSCKKLAFASFMLARAFDAMGSDDTPIVMPRDLNVVQIYLHTVDVGGPLYTKFGHTAIRIQDPLTSTDQVYNLGTFDATDPLFAINFYRGKMYYRMSDYPQRIATRWYIQDQRTMWQDRINFSNEQKKRFLEKMIWQSLPENRLYEYQYFFDNCSTRIRDYIDHAMNGQLKSTTFDRITPDSFRLMVRSHFESLTFVKMSLDILMNGRLDRPMTAWEEMFLPMRLRSNLEQQKSDDGTSLLSSSEILLQGITPKNDTVSAYLWMNVLLAWPFLALIVTRNARWITLQASFWGVWSGFLGCLMVANWAVSGHLDLHHNANILIFFPLDLMFVRFRDFKSNNPNKISKRIIKAYSWSRIAMIVAIITVCKSDFFHQDIWPVAITFGLLGIMTFATQIVMTSFSLEASRSSINLT